MLNSIYYSFSLQKASTYYFSRHYLQATGDTVHSLPHLRIHYKPGMCWPYMPWVLARGTSVHQSEALITRVGGLIRKNLRIIWNCRIYINSLPASIPPFYPLVWILYYVLTKGRVLDTEDTMAGRPRYSCCLIFTKLHTSPSSQVLPNLGIRY